MARKLQSYYVLKLETDRLKKVENNLTITITEARKNGELISLGDSQVLRTLRRLKGIESDQEHINELFKLKKKLKNARDTKENRKALKEIEDEIDQILFIPELISILVKDNRHYSKLIENGLTVNGRKFVRLLCGAGNARRNTVIFVDEDYEKELKRVLNNNRADISLLPSKFNAYFALSNSATIPVSTPRFCVVKDYEFDTVKEVDYITDNGDGTYEIEEKSTELKSNAFDGQGLISVQQAEKWSFEIGLDWIPSAWCIRSNFVKGMVCVFDFHKFAKEVGHKEIITDAWGNEVNISDVDVILSVSQFKLWNAYQSCDDYVVNCQKNGLGWGISRYTPKKDNDHINTNYQFLQVLNIDDKQIERLCEKTIGFFYKTSGGDVKYTLLYLLGKLADDDMDLDDLNDPVLKCLIYNNSLIHDPYIKQTVAHTLNKKIKESYTGNLIVNGNYQTMISDPYAMAEHIFGMNVVGLLKEGQHYSGYWNKKNVSVVAAMRAPLTWRSEVNILHLQKNEKTEEWYKYLSSGIIYNIHGSDCMLHADSDFDMDLSMTTDQKEIIDGAYGGLPITYEKGSGTKKPVAEDELYIADIASFNSKIGFITNCSTTLYSLLEYYDTGSKEYDEIYTRLKTCRYLQGMAIDKAKLGTVDRFPEHWTKFTKIKPDMSAEEAERAEFNNKLLIEKRPYFMRYLYLHYNKKYKDHKEIYDTIAIAKFGFDMDHLLRKKELSEEETKVLQMYNDRGYFINSGCVMNKICWYMESKVKEIKTKLGKTNEGVLDILLDKDCQIDEDKVEQMNRLFAEYKSYKHRDFSTDYGNDSHNYNLIHYIQYIRQKANDITSNGAELANLAVWVCYVVNPSANKDFIWKIFGEELVDNVYKNRQDVITIPKLDDDGDVEYLGSRYKFLEINV